MVKRILQQDKPKNPLQHFTSFELAHKNSKTTKKRRSKHHLGYKNCSELLTEDEQSRKPNDLECNLICLVSSVFCALYFLYYGLETKFRIISFVILASSALIYTLKYRKIYSTEHFEFVCFILLQILKLSIFIFYNYGVDFEVPYIRAIQSFVIRDSMKISIISILHNYTQLFGILTLFTWFIKVLHIISGKQSYFLTAFAMFVVSIISLVQYYSFWQEAHYFFNNIGLGVVLSFIVCNLDYFLPPENLYLYSLTLLVNVIYICGMIYIGNLEFFNTLPSRNLVNLKVI